MTHCPKAVISIQQIILTPLKCAGEFDDVLDSSNKKGDHDSKEKIQLSFCLISCSNGLHTNGSMPLSKRVKLLHVEHLTVQTPSEATLIKDLSFEIFEKDHLLVSSDMSTFSFYVICCSVRERKNCTVNGN